MTGQGVLYIRIKPRFEFLYEEDDDSSLEVSYLEKAEEISNHTVSNSPVQPVVNVFRSGDGDDKQPSQEGSGEFHLDLLWWYQFLAEWHGVSFWLFPGLLPETDVKVSSNAAGSLGYGAYLKGQWFAGPWPPSQQSQSIAYKELFPIVLAGHVWGHSWVKKHVLFRSDNDAVVHILIIRTSRVPCLMQLLHSLLFSAARHSFSFSSQHVPGVSNQLADAFSCFNWQEFRRLAPEAQPLPTVVPPELLAELTSPL